MAVRVERVGVPYRCGHCGYWRVLARFTTSVPGTQPVVMAINACACDVPSRRKYRGPGHAS